MSNTNKHLWFAVFLLVTVLLYRYIFIDSRPQQYDANSKELIASIQSALQPYRNSLDSALVALEEIQAANASLTDSLGRINAAIRRQPTRMVEVPVIRLAECDSAMIVGQALQKENQAQAQALEDSRELNAVQDTAITDLSAELDSCDAEHGRKDVVIASQDEDLKNEKQGKRFWQSTSATILTIATVIITTLVL